MARKWGCTFGLNDLAKEMSATSGTVSITTSNQRVVNGDPYSLRANPTTATGWANRAITAAGSGNFPNTFRFYLLVTSYPSATTGVFSAFSGGGFNSGIRMTTSGALQLIDNGSGTPAQVGSNSSALSTGTWYYIEFQTNWNTNAFSARINGVSFASGTVSQPNGALVDTVYFGVNTEGGATATADLQFDDLAWNDGTTGGGQTSFPGAGAMIHLHPNGAGDFNSGTSTPSSTAGYIVTGTNDNPTPDDVTSYWALTVAGTTTTGDRLDCVCESLAPSATSITLVQVGMRFRGATASSCNVVLRIKSQASGTILESSTNALASTSFTTNPPIASGYHLTSYTDPQAGGSWTTALVNSMQIGIRSTDVSPNPQVTAMWALVEYIPSSFDPSTFPYFEYPDYLRRTYDVVDY